MSLKDWANNGWFRSHKTSPQEIQNLFGIVERDLSDARQKEVSADWRFGIKDLSSGRASGRRFRSRRQIICRAPQRYASKERESRF